jgi:hypothetical protein
VVVLSIISTFTANGSNTGYGEGNWIYKVYIISIK